MKIRMSTEKADVKGWLEKLAEKYHFEVSDYKALKTIYEQMKLHMEPYASYRLNHRMTGIPMIDNAQAAIVAMTLGSGIDSLKERYIQKEKLTEAYMVDCIANELLLDMYGEFNRSYAKFHRRYVKQYVFIGNEISPVMIPAILNDIRGYKLQKAASSGENETVECADEIVQQKEAAELLRDREEITANEYGVLTPSKSVVFYALLTENPNTVCEGVCSGCGNAACENRISGHEKQTDKLKEMPKPQALHYGAMRIFGS